jgi:hypothetical protein
VNTKIPFEAVLEKRLPVHFAFSCATCGEPGDFLIELRCEGSDEDPTYSIRKLGQRPPPSIEIAKEIEGSLQPESLAAYRKARISLNQGFGIGACAYLRAILEAEVVPILTMIREAREAEGAGQEELDEIQGVIDGKVGADKMKLAADHAPRSLVVEGTNPLKLIYELLSSEVHGLDDPAACEVAEKLVAALDFVVRELHRAKRDRAEFAKKIQSLSGS